MIPPLGTAVEAYSFCHEAPFLGVIVPCPDPDLAPTIIDWCWVEPVTLNEPGPILLPATSVRPL